MKRRELLGILGGAAIWPLSARAQQVGAGDRLPSTMRHLPPTAHRFPHFGKAWSLPASQNIAMSRSSTVGLKDTMISCPASLVNLVRQDVSVIVAGGGDNAVMAAKRATATIPIVFISGSDPVRSGFVASLSHPGDNITGLSLATPELLAKRLEILHKLAPQLTSFAALVNPENTNIEVQLQYLADTARRIGIPIPVVNATRKLISGPRLTKLPSAG